MFLENILFHGSKTSPNMLELNQVVPHVAREYVAPVVCASSNIYVAFFHAIAANAKYDYSINKEQFFVDSKSNLSEGYIYFLKKDNFILGKYPFEYISYMPVDICGYLKVLPGDFPKNVVERNYVNK
jgi:hypothetical protein